MPPEIRIVGLASHLPGPAISCRQLAETLGVSADVLERQTAIPTRHHASPGQGPSDLAREAAALALERARTALGDLGLLIFATATPDVTFPGAACYLQEKLGTPTVGALDVRAQSVGFLCALELATAFAEQAASEKNDRYARVMVAAGEVFSSGMDESPAGADLAARLADGAAVAIVGPGTEGPRVGAIRWAVDGTLADRFWCEYPASGCFPQRISAAALAEGLHYPRASLAEIAPVARERLSGAVREVLEEMSWTPESVDALVIDYVDPVLAREVGETAGFPASRTTVPTAQFGHVMAAGLPIALDRLSENRRLQGRIVIAAAGPGLAWGAAALEA
jgi:3-oxoacyl-[acyl-carrier-protein] synthase III